MDQETHKQSNALEIEQVVVFKLAGEEYASPILDVQEIITSGDITPFPNVPEYIAGIINVRGTVATVVNLAKRFGLHRTDQEHAVDKYCILTKTDKGLFGISVDEVTSVMKINKENIKPASGVSDAKIHTDYVSGVAVVDSRVILILSFEKILADESAIQDGNTTTISKSQSVEPNAGTSVPTPNEIPNKADAEPSKGLDEATQSNMTKIN